VLLFLAIASRNNITVLFLACKGLLYQVKREDSCPPEEVEFMCGNNNDVPLIQWTVTSLLSDYTQNIAFHTQFDYPGISRFTVIDNFVVNATFLYGNSSWYLSSLIIPSALSSEIICNTEFLHYHSPINSK